MITGIVIGGLLFGAGAYVFLRAAFTRGFKMGYQAGKVAQREAVHRETLTRDGIP
jgi:hypothetical protein